jgi:hypothetical protein
MSQEGNSHGNRRNALFRQCGALAVKKLDDLSPVWVTTMKSHWVVLLGLMLVSAQCLPMAFVLRGMVNCTEDNGCLRVTNESTTYLIDEDQSGSNHEIGSSVESKTDTSCMQKMVAKITINAGCISRTYDNTDSTESTDLASPTISWRLSDATWEALSRRLTEIASDASNTGQQVWDPSLFLEQVNIHRQIANCFNASWSEAILGDPDVDCVNEWRSKYSMNNRGNHEDVVSFGIRALYSVHNLVLILEGVVTQYDIYVTAGFPSALFSREALVNKGADSNEKYHWDGVWMQDTTGPSRLSDDAWNERFSTRDADIGTAQSLRIFHYIRLALPNSVAKLAEGKISVDPSVRADIAIPDDSGGEFQWVFIPEEYIWPSEYDRSHDVSGWYFGGFGLHANGLNHHFTEEVVRGFDVGLKCYQKYDPIPGVVPHDYNQLGCSDSWSMFPLVARCQTFNLDSAPATHRTQIFKCTKTVITKFSKSPWELLSEAQALGGLFFSLTLAATTFMFSFVSKQPPSLAEITLELEQLQKRYDSDSFPSAAA